MYIYIWEGFIRVCRVVSRWLNMHILFLFSSLWEQLWFSRPPLTRVRDQILQIITKVYAKAGMIFSYFPFMNHSGGHAQNLAYFTFCNRTFHYIGKIGNMGYPSLSVDLSSTFVQCFDRYRLEFVINACHL